MNSIRVRLLAMLMVVLALAALAMGGVTYRYVLGETQALFDYHLRQMALSLRDQGEIALPQAGALADRQLDFVIQIWSADGRTIYATRPHDELPTRALLGWADISAGGQAWRTFGVSTGQRVIQVAQPKQIRQQLAARAAWHSVVPLLGVAPLMALLVWVLTARTLRPLRSVASAVAERDTQSLAPLPAAGLPDELAPLVQALNTLLQRLGQTLDTQRAFVADAAHELRSPLTALKLQLGLLERASDDATRRAAAKALAEGVERAGWLVEQLLALARNEPAAALPMAPVDLAEIARQAMSASLPLALARGSELELRADAALPVVGNAASLSALVRNLVDNALRYAPAGSRIEVTAASVAGRPTLTVDDPGPGIPADEHEHVFDRFYRRDHGGDGMPGSGLGLAIVRTVAERHGATVALDDAPQGGLRATVRFAPPPPS